MVMSRPLVMTAVRNASPSRLRADSHVDGADAGDLAAFAVDGVAPHEGGMVDDDMHGVFDAFGGAVTEEHVGEDVGGVGVVGFVVFAGTPRPEDLLHFAVDDRFDLPADLGGEAKPAFDHPVGGGPHPQLRGAACWRFGPFGRVLVVGVYPLAGVFQRAGAELRGTQQPFLCLRVDGRGLGDQRGLRRGQPPVAHRRLGRGQRLQLCGGRDRPARLTDLDTDRVRDERCRVAFTRTGMRGRVMHPVRRLRPHPVDQPLDQPELAHRVRGARTVKQTRVEFRSERRSSGVKRIEHQFVLYRSEEPRKHEKPQCFQALSATRQDWQTNNQTSNARPPSLRSLTNRHPRYALLSMK